MDVKQLFSLKDKVAIITGGSKGLGLMMAEGFAEAGQNWCSAQENLINVNRPRKKFVSWEVNV